MAGWVGMLCWEVTGKINELVLGQKHHRRGYYRLAGAAGSWKRAVCLNSHPVRSSP